MATKKVQSKQKIALTLDQKTIEAIDRLELPVAGLPAQVRYLLVRGIQALEAEKAMRTTK